MQMIQYWSFDVNDVTFSGSLLTLTHTLMYNTCLSFKGSWNAHKFVSHLDISMLIADFIETSNWILKMKNESASVVIILTLTINFT